MDEEHIRHSRDSMVMDGTVDTNLEDQLLQYDTETIVGGAFAPNRPTIYTIKWSGAHNEHSKYIDKNVKENRFSQRLTPLDLCTNAYHKRSIYRSKWKRNSLDIPQRNLKKKKKNLRWYFTRTVPDFQLCPEINQTCPGFKFSK